MSDTNETTTCFAAHDLNGVHTLYIRGWHPDHVLREPTSDNGNIKIEVPSRHPAEFWTFSKAGGYMTLFTSLLGTPALVEPEPVGTMIIRLPASRATVLEILYY